VQAALQGALAAAAETARLCCVLEAEAGAAAGGLAAAARRAARRQRAGQWAVTDEDADIAGVCRQRPLLRTSSASTPRERG
jgi:hypothetical protein